MQRALGLALVVGLLISATAWAAPIDERLQALAHGTIAERASAATRLAELEDPRVDDLLKLLAAGKLYRQRSTDRIVVAERGDSGYLLSDPLTGDVIGSARRRDVRRIAVNNALREQLAELRAARALTANTPGTRRAAVDALMGTTDPTLLAAINTRLLVEEDPRTRTRLEAVLATAELARPTRPDAGAEVLKARLEAIESLAGNTHPEVRRLLLARANDAAASAEERSAATRSMQVTKQKLDWIARFETLFFGLSLGSVLVLAAMGLAITFGVMGVINMAHGELIMIGAYTAFVSQSLLPATPGLALLLSIPLAFVVAGGVGMLLERTVIRHLYGRPLETLLATFGVSLVLQQSVRSLFSPLNQTVVTPDALAGTVELFEDFDVTVVRLSVVAFSLAVFLIVQWLLRSTRLGLAIRAVAQNRRMATALGVRGSRIDALTFGLGAGIAGIAGVALSQLTNVGPNMGQAYIIDSFLVVVFGGVGSLWGTLLGGLSIGMANKVLEPLTGAVLAKILVLVLIIAFIQRRPEGLFPNRGRAARG
ncbi:MAG: urea ABC transporter permease subunit UrtB [Pseudomonadota bacterium]